MATMHTRYDGHPITITLLSNLSCAAFDDSEISAAVGDILQIRFDGSQSLGRLFVALIENYEDTYGVRSN